MSHQNVIESGILPKNSEKKHNTKSALPSVKLTGIGGPELDALEAMQKAFGLICLEGKIWGFNLILLKARTIKGTAEKLTLSNRNDLKLLIKRALRVQFPNINADKIFEEFLVNQNTACYYGIEFNPGITSDDYLNLWVGPTITPKQGKWPLVKSFLLKIICDGDQTAYDYLIRYIAHALQHPEEKPGIIIILIGGQGIGKGTFGRILQLIWSATYLQVHNISSVTGNFNASLERTFIIFMDEALFAGDRRAADALKSLVTEEFIQVNEKFQPARQIRSYHRFIAATNADHFKNTERDDRRDFTLRVSESRKGDHDFWNDINQEIKNGGVAAMVADLLAMDLSDFNVRDKPNTKELLEQKLNSLDHIARWWFERLMEGSIFEDEEKWQDFVSTEKIIEGTLADAGGRIYRRPGPRDVVREMKKLCPSAVHGQKQKFGMRNRGFILPTLQQARAEFEDYIDAPIEWPEEALSADQRPNAEPSEIDF